MLTSGTVPPAAEKAPAAKETALLTAETFLPTWVNALSAAGKSSPCSSKIALSASGSVQLLQEKLNQPQKHLR
jgi:hypothetical protein